MKRYLALLLAALMFATSSVGFVSHAANEGLEDEQIMLLGVDDPQSVSATADERYAIFQSKTASGVYRRAIGWSSAWYDALEPFEIVTRLVYGEAPWWVVDKQATAWVLWNRRQSESTLYHPANDRTLYGVATHTGQFAAITGGAQASEAARIPTSSTASWNNSGKFVSMIWAAVIEASTPNGVLPVPEGYSDQKEFRGYSSFFTTDTTKSRAFDENGVAKYRIVHANGTESESQIHDICIPGVGVYDSVKKAKEAYDTKYEDADGERVNIYFSWSP